MTQSHTPPQWLRPPGVSAGVWKYAHERTIADHYDQFVADTPLCKLDAAILSSYLPPVGERPGAFGEPGTVDAKNLPLPDKSLADQFSVPDATCPAGISRPGEYSAEATVLDLGCGTGRLAIPLALSGYQVIGVDLSYRMLATMVKKLHSPKPSSDQTTRSFCHGGPIHPLHANLVDLKSLRSDVADHAVCMFSTLGMIQGRANRRAVLAHTSRIVRSGGQLIVHVHRRWASLREPGGLRRLAQSYFRSVTSKQFEFGDAIYEYRGLSDMFMHRFSKRELVSDLQTTGWRVAALHLVSLDGSEIVSRARHAGGFIAVASAT